MLISQVTIRHRNLHAALAAREVLSKLILEILEQKNRLILWLPVVVGFGIAAYFQLKTEPPIIFGLSVTVFSGSVLALVWPHREKDELSFIAFLAASFCFWFCVGFATAQLRTHYIAAPVLDEEIGPVYVEGQIENLDRLDDANSVRVVLTALSIENLRAENTPKKVRVKVHHGEGLREGMRIKLLAGLNPPSPPVAPGLFDFQRYSWFKQLGGVGFAYSKPEVISQEKAGLFSLDYLRQVVSEHVTERVKWPDAAIVTALMTGELAAIPDEDMDAMRNSGLAHMLALSGMNVGIIAGCVFFVSRFLMALFPSFALQHPIKKYSAILAFGAIYGYTFFVGANVPVFRALLMTGVVLIAVLLERKAFSMRLVALSAFAILLIFPESLTGASFQMSFSAVAALIWFFDTFREKISSIYRKAGLIRKGAIYVLGICVTTVIATLATAPFSLYHFQQLALYGVIANLFAVPVMSFVIMPAVVLSYITIPLGLDFLTLPIAGKGVDWMRDIAHWTSSLEGSVLLVPQWPQLGFALLICGVIFTFLWKGYFKLAGIPVFLAGIFVILGHSQPDILVSSSGKLAAFRDAQGKVYASSRIYDRYDLENWARMYGQQKEDVGKWPREGGSEAGLECGELGCRLISNGKKIAFTEDPYAIREDCAWADILISRRPVRDRDCRANKIIDFFDVWRSGAHSIHLNKSAITIQNVRLQRGERPWHGSPSR